MEKKKRIKRPSRSTASSSIVTRHTTHPASKRNDRHSAERGNLLLEMYENASQFSDRQLYDFALEHAVRLTDSSIGFLHLVSEDQKEIILTTWNEEAKKNCSASFATHYPIEEAGNWVDCVRLKRPVVYNNFLRSPHRKGLPAGHTPIRRFMSIPVMEDDNVRIIFGVGNKIEKYSRHDIIHIQLIASELQKIIKQRHAEETVREQYATVRSIIDSSDSAIFSVDRQYRYTTFNSVHSDVMKSIYGKEIEINSVLLDYMTVDEDRARAKANIDRALSGLQFVENSYSGEARLSRRYFEVSHNPIFGADRTVIGVVVFAKDITERKKAEIEIARVNRALRMLSDSNQALIHITNERKLLDEVCRIIVEIGGYRLAWVGFAVNDEAQTLQPVASAGYDDRYIMDANVSWGENEKGKGPSGIAYRTGKPCIVRDIPSDPRFAPWRTAALERGYKSIIAVPLRSGAERIGVMGIYSGEPDAFDEKEVDILKELASDLAYGISTLRIRAKHDQSEETLQQSEEKLRSVFNTVDEALTLNELIYDRTGRIVDYRILEVNPAFERDTGLKRQQAVGRNATEIYGMSPEYISSFWQEHLHDEHAIATDLYVPQTNAWKHIITSIPVQGRFVVSYSDITNRKRAEEKLKESEERLRLTLEATSIGIWDWDIKNDRWYASPTYYTMLGYPPAAGFADRSEWLERVHPDDREAVREKIQNVLTRNFAGYSYEARMRHADGTYRWQSVLGFGIEREDDGTVTRMLGTRMDINDRKQAEEALRVSTERYRIITENTADTITVLDLDLRPTYVSPSVEKLRGFTAQETLSQTLDQILTPESLAKVYEAFHEQMKLEDVPGADPSRTVMLEIEEYRKDGSTIWAELSAAFLRDSNGSVNSILTVTRDITERKRSEMQLQSSEQKFRSLAESMPDNIIRYDTEGRLVYVNPNVDLTMDFHLNLYIGSYPPENQEKFPSYKEYETKLNNVIRNGDSDEMEAVIIDNTGCQRIHHIRFIAEKNSSGTIIGALAIGRDITRQKIAETELRRLFHSIEQSPVSVIMTNTDGNIEYVNPKFTEITGYTLNEVRGKKPSILKSGETPATEYENLWKTITAGGQWQGEFHNRKKNGELFWEAVSISPVRDEKGAIAQYVAIKEDITARKQAEEELRQNAIKRQELERELLQSQKLESLGTLASGIAHDFNNILGIIMGQSSLVKSSLPDPDKLQKRLDAIDKACERGASIVKQLLTFARKSESVFQSVSVDRIIDEVIQLLRETIPKTINVTTNLKKGNPSIVADATQIHQVLLNLCVNARDAMPKGGDLIIATETVTNQQVVEAFPKAGAREYVMVTVTDTGIGMESDTRQRIFDPFFTTKGPGKGTGLGLALVYSIVESHHGMIAVESAPGKGTTFRLYFPVEERTFESILSVAHRADDIPGGTETILVIDDEETLLDLLQEILTEKGYTVIAATNGEEGVSLFADHRNEISAVLSDMGLPVFSGDEVFRRIRSIDPDARVILASGFIDPAEKSELLTSGLCHFIQKPYSNAEVLQAVRDAIDKDH